MFKYDLTHIVNWGVISELKKDQQMIEDVRTSTESLYELKDSIDELELDNEGLVNLVGTINDVVLRLFNNFKAIVLKGGKRSELKYFYESNTSAVKRIEGKTMDAYADLMVDFPTGMAGTYKDAVEAITSVYATMNVRQIVNTAMDTADTILSSMSKGAKTHEDVVAVSDKVLEGSLNKQMNAMKVFGKLFTGKTRGKETKKLSTLFKSIDDIKACRMTLLSQEDRLLESVEINNRLEKAYESVGLTVEFMKNSLESKDPDAYVPSKQFIKSYMDYVGRLGMAVSNYGEVIVAQMAVEHNLALVYSKMMEA